MDSVLDAHLSSSNVEISIIHESLGAREERWFMCYMKCPTGQATSLADRFPSVEICIYFHSNVLQWLCYGFCRWNVHTAFHKTFPCNNSWQEMCSLLYSVGVQEKKAGLAYRWNFTDANILYNRIYLCAGKFCEIARFTQFSCTRIYMVG